MGVKEGGAKEVSARSDAGEEVALDSESYSDATIASHLA